jgi:hypothetical protein
MKRFKIILMGLLVTGVIAGLYGYNEYNRVNEDLETLKPDASLSAGELIKAFEANEKNAMASLLGKIVLVSGVINTIEKDEMGYTTVVLGFENSTSSVRCSMDTLHTAKKVLPKNGELIKLKGVCTGFNADDLLGSDVVLNRCIIEKK